VLSYRVTGASGDEQRKITAYKENEDTKVPEGKDLRKDHSHSSSKDEGENVRGRGGGPEGGKIARLHRSGKGE